MSPSTNGNVTNGIAENETIETLPGDRVLIVGGGPVGLVLATTLAKYGISSMAEDGFDQRKIYGTVSNIGLADSLREQGVPSNFPYVVRFSRSLHDEDCIAQWDLPSVDQYHANIRAQNDGTLPLEPYQRLSQAIFEKWLKEHCDSNQLIDTRFGWKLETIEELAHSSKVLAVNQETGERKQIVTKYLAGCDGASSRIRRQLEIPLEGGPVPGYALLVHFKSKDLSRLHRQGQFWHIFFLDGGIFRGAIIAQDEKDTWTTHLMLPLEVDASSIDTHDAIYTVLGGKDKYQIEVDEILVRSTYRPSIAIAQRYSSPNGLIHLAGDAAHQNIPTGGYGMNLGLADAFDLGWKLATVISKKGGMGLLRAYGEERRPVALQCIDRSGAHNAVHFQAAALLASGGSNTETQPSDGKSPHDLLREHYHEHDGENKDLGIEMGYRYKSSICLPDLKHEEPLFTPSHYSPTTWPGGRAPHVFLTDGTPLFDLYGKFFTLVDFSTVTTNGSQYLIDAANRAGVPLKHVELRDERHAHGLWEMTFVIVRPDGHVAWRGDSVGSLESAEHIVSTIAGLRDVGEESRQGASEGVTKPFTNALNSEAQVSDYELEKMGEFQR